MSTENEDTGKKENGGTGKKIVFIGVSILLLMAVAVAIIVGVNINKKGSNDDTKNDKTNHVTSTVKAIQNMCHPTNYKKECEESLVAGAGNTTDPRELVKIAFNITITKIGDKIKETNLMHDVEKDPRAKMALDTCKQLMDLSIEELARSLEGIEEFDLLHVDKILMNLKVWLSGAITYQDTCLDGFENTTSEAGKKMKDLLMTGMHMTSNALGIITYLANVVTNSNVTNLLGRRLLQDSKFPSWVDDHHHRILSGDESRFKRKPNVTVAKDGSGDFKTINEALMHVPKKNEKPFVIYIKEGIYQEYVEVSKKMTHVVFIGDGGKKTRITGNKNFIDGINTYKTSTVAVQGDHFVAIKMGFENSAGPEKHQAVALRVQSDKSIFYNCSMDAYQDTLYVHTMRQFYRDCTISGTIDFVFGNALSFFQNCTFVVRKPMEHQQCIVTAQGRKELQQPSGIIIQGGSIVSDPEFYPVRFDNKAYLARPWKNYSRTIIMDTFIDDLIHTDGYLPWQGLEGPSGMDSCFYAEYHNIGPGAEKSKRVKWNGIWNLNSKTAHLFSPAKFFHGTDWIKATGIPVFPGILEHHRHTKTIINWSSS